MMEEAHQPLMIQSRTSDIPRKEEQYRTRCSCGWKSEWTWDLSKAHQQLTTHIFSKRKAVA